MPSSRRSSIRLFVLLLFIPTVVFGQAQPKQNPPQIESGGALGSRASEVPPHRFWDRENVLLFAGVGAVRMLDYASTQHFRSQGVDEWLLSNDIVDNKPLFLGIELAGVAASIGVSYLLHRTGHHKVERWISFIHIGVGVAGSIRNYTLSAPSPSAYPQ